MESARGLLNFSFTIASTFMVFPSSLRGLISNLQRTLHPLLYLRGKRREEKFTLMGSAFCPVHVYGQGFLFSDFGEVDHLSWRISLDHRPSPLKMLDLFGNCFYFVIGLDLRDFMVVFFIPMLGWTSELDPALVHAVISSPSFHWTLLMAHTLLQL